MKSSFEYQLGQRAARRRNETKQEQIEPPISGQALEEWRRGYGGKGKPCPKKPAQSAEGFATSCDRRQNKEASSATATSALVAAVQVATTKPKQSTLFGETKESKRKSAAKPDVPESSKPPLPLPFDEVADEVKQLVAIGLTPAEADDLVRVQRWTLDALVCAWKLGNEHSLPAGVLGRVAKYGQQMWGDLKSC